MKIENLKKIAIIIKGSAWGEDKKMPRIYFQSAKGRKVYFSFPDFDGSELGGARLNVFIDDCGQSSKWYASQKQIEISRRFAAVLALMAAQYDEANGMAQADAIMDEDFDASQVDEASSHFVNGRLAEAYTVLGI